METTTTATNTTATQNLKPRIATKKNFRASADIENFYRFVSENTLRREAKLILAAIMKVANDNRKKKKDTKKH